MTKELKEITKDSKINHCHSIMSCEVTITKQKEWKVKTWFANRKTGTATCLKFDGIFLN